MNRYITNAQFFINFPTMAVSFLLPLYCNELGFSAIETTGLFAAFSFFLCISKLIAGRLCDRIGRKPIFLAGLIIGAISYLILAYAQRVIPLYIAQFLKGVAFSLLSVSTYVILADDTTVNIALSMGELSGMNGRAGILGVLLSVFLFYRMSFKKAWRYFFLICTVLAVYAIVMSKRQMDSKIIEKRRTIQKKEVSRLPRKKIRNLLMMNAIFSLSMNIIAVIIVLFLVDKFSSDLEAIIVALFIPAIFITFLKPKIGAIAVRMGEERAFLSGLGLSSIVLILMPIVKTIFLFAVCWTVYNIGILLSQLAFDAIYAGNTTEEDRGKLSGMYSGSTDIGNCIGALVSGGVFYAVHPDAPFFISAILFLMIIFVIVIRKVSCT